MYRKSLFSGIVFTVLTFVLAACGNEPEFQPSEFRIPAGEVQEKLNIDPVYIRPQNKAVVTAHIESGGIVIRSAGPGGTTVYIGDSAGLANSARIDAKVDTGGGINVRISPFEGRRVTAVVKNDVVISGTAGSAISPAVVYLMMDNNDFSAVTNGMDASAWIENLPSGLTAVISYVQGGGHPHEVNLTVTGTPQSVCFDVLKITVPAGNNAMAWDVYAETRPGAKFNITE